MQDISGRKGQKELGSQIRGNNEEGSLKNETEGSA